MYIETAFFRFNEALIRNAIQKYHFNEEQVRGLFAQSIVDELSSRLVSFPSLMVNLQKKYELSRDVKKSLLADIYVNFTRNSFDHSLGEYGFASENWIEIKYFSGQKPRSNQTAKTTNTARLLKDILRLIVLTAAKEVSRKRYLLMVFDQKPETYLATNIKGFGERTWLTTLLDQKLSQKNLMVDFSNEKPHFIREVGNCQTISEINLSVTCQTFLPRPKDISSEQMSRSGILLYSYLIRIDNFTLSWNGKTIPTSDSKETYDYCRELSKTLWGHRKLKKEIT